MVVNGLQLRHLMPIKGMLGCKQTEHGVSHGLGEAGYDIRIAQNVTFSRSGDRGEMWVTVRKTEQGIHTFNQVGNGRFALASAMEEFQMPNNLVGIVHDKSTWARRGLSVFNTVIEPGFKGGLTLELVYHGSDELIIPAGAGIAQVMFHSLSEPAEYSGKYQGQSTNPEPARSS